MRRMTDDVKTSFGGGGLGRRARLVGHIPYDDDFRNVLKEALVSEV